MKGNIEQKYILSSSIYDLIASASVLSKRYKLNLMENTCNTYN